MPTGSNSRGKNRNHKLIDARKRLTSASGEPMTPQDIAEAMNAFLWEQNQKIKGSPEPTTLDHRYVSSYEAGRHWWPSKQYRAAWRHALHVETDAELGFTPKRRNRTMPPPSAPAPDVASDIAAIQARGQDCAEVDLVELTSSLEQHGMSSTELAALELACERLDLEFAQESPDGALAKIRVLMKRVSARLRQTQTLGHHERLVALAARLAGLRAWACFDIDEHSSADRWYEIAVAASQEARAWGLGAWLLGAQSLIPWHRRDFDRAGKLIERGICFAGHGSDATTRAWLYALHARRCAGMGNIDGFDTAYAFAEEAAEYSNERDRRHGMDFTDGTLDLRYYGGTSRLLLQQPTRAKSELTASLVALPESHNKARAVLQLFLADAAAQAGDVGSATSLARQALTSTINQPIVPILQQARRIRRLVQQRDPAESESLNDPIRGFGRALTAVASKAKS